MICAAAPRVLAAALLAGAAATEFPKAVLPYGEVLGNPLASVDEFLGIPYAQPPVGIRRFAAPQPWAGPYPQGRLDGTRSRAACMQSLTSEGVWFQPGIVPVSEDCLFLNIYRPRVKPRGNASQNETSPQQETRVPVMLWIHGGSLLHGTGSMPAYNATELAAQEGVVVVTINYRLNVFGFSPVVTLGGSVANNGWRDQQEAMRWVQKHIAAFGGDPKRVTLFGQSAGGQSVFAQLLNPGSVGLFSRAISQSGDLSVMLSLNAGLENTRKIALDVGCSGPADLACLRDVSAESLLQASCEQLEPFAVIDGDFLPGPPMQLVEDGKFNKGIPFVMGWNERDAKIFSYPGIRFPSSGSLLSKDEAQCVFEGLLGKNAQRVMDVYPPRQSFGVFDNRDIIIELATDLLYGCPNTRIATALAEKNASAWVYSFQRRPSCSPTQYPGPVHGAEMAYVFGNQETMAALYRFVARVSCQVSPQDKALSRTIMGLWGAFARDGEPPAQWPRWDVQAQSALKLEMASSSRLATEMGIRSGQCQVLKSVNITAVDTYIHFRDLLLDCQGPRRLAERAPPVLV